jgi:hypothetical protein
MLKGSKLVIVILIALFICAACTRPPQTEEPAQESTILQEGSTQPNPDYFVSDTGEVIYKGNPSGADDEHDPSFPVIFTGSQRIYPANDDPKLRESYLTDSPIDQVRLFYQQYLDIRTTDYVKTHDLAQDFAVVQSIEFRDPDGRRQVALYVNKNEGPRGGQKVLMQEFPSQHAVQIILTTLDATPPGLNPMGYWITPEEVEEYRRQAAQQQEEEQRKRDEAERSANEQGQTGGTSGG